MSAQQSVMQARIYHKRLSPKINEFGYRLTYLALPLSNLEQSQFWPFFGVNRPALLSFWNRDHGDRDGTDLRAWVSRMLADTGAPNVEGETVLVTLPRLFGYVFNPVSFWLCHDRDKKLVAVIAEVNNTFGETHSYVCVPETGREIRASDCFYADKEFHVSPFFERSGYYRFCFDAEGEELRIRIDYFDENNCLELATSISASSREWTFGNLFWAWLKSPLMALKAISLIHWQALKLLRRSAGYKAKPEQHRWFYTRAVEAVPTSLQQPKQTTLQH